MKNTIGVILFRKVFFGYLFVALLLVAYQINNEYTFAKNIVQENIDSTRDSFYKILANSVWHFDEVQIKNNIEAILKRKNIVGISVLSPKDEVFYQGGVILENEQKFSDFIFDKNEKILYTNSLDIHSFELMNDNFSSNMIAKVNLYTREDVVFEIMKESVYIILINSVIKTLVLWFLFLYFAREYLTIPLKKMIEASKDLDVDEDKEVNINLNEKTKSEFTLLANSFNKMSQRVKTAYQDLKEKSIELKREKKKLENANQYKDDFFANMSHEFKTPLNAINIISSIMSRNSKDELNEEQVKNLKIINKSGKDLLNIINIILEATELENNEVQVKKSEFSLNTLIDSLVKIYKPLFEEKNIEFVYSNIDIQIETDFNKLKQILDSFLSNALKFSSEKKKVELSIYLENGKIKISVKDEGIGIPKKLHKSIFEKFKQADSSKTRKYGGVGLGLYVSKKLAILIESHIEVESEEGIGSSFTLIFDNEYINLDIEDTQENLENEFIEFEDISSIDEVKKVFIMQKDPMKQFELTVKLRKEGYEVETFTKHDKLIKNLNNLNERIVLVLDDRFGSFKELKKGYDNIDFVLLCEEKDEEAKLCFDYDVSYDDLLKGIKSI